MIAISLSNQEPHSDRAADDIADPETTTPHGCTCSSICGPTVEDGFSVSVMKKRKPFKKVRLAFSWTGVTPQMNVESTVTFMVTGTIANTWHRPNRIGWQWIGN